MKDKLGTAYKTIGEVAKDLNLINPKNGKLNTHTIRFWEKEFKNIKPKIFAGKRRYYDNESIELLKKRVKVFVMEDGLPFIIKVKFVVLSGLTLALLRLMIGLMFLGNLGQKQNQITMPASIYRQR